MGADYRRTRICIMLFHTMAALLANQTRYFTNSNPDAIEATQTCIIPLTGTLRRLFVGCSAPPGAGESFVFTVMINGIASVLTATIADLAVDSTDLVNMVPVIEGDRISIRCVSSAAAANSYVKASLSLIG